MTKTPVESLVSSSSGALSRSGFLVLALSFSFLCASGCESGTSELPEAEEVQNPFEGQTVEVNLPKALQLVSSWELVLDEWSARTGADAVVRQHDDNDLDSEDSPLKAELSAEGASQVDVIPLTEVAALADAGALSVIPDDQQSEVEWHDFFRSLTTGVTKYGHKQIIVPVAVPVLVCYYREDLLKQAGRLPPETWEDYFKLVAELSDWAAGKTAVEPWGEAFRSTMFLARAISFAKHPDNYSVFFDISTGVPLIDSAPFVRALEKSLSVVKQMPEDVLRYSPADCRRAILSGDAAIAIGFETTSDHPNGLFGPRGGEPSVEQDPLLERPEDVQLGIVPLPGAMQVYNVSTSEWETPAGDGINRATLAGFAGFGVAAHHTENTSPAACWSVVKTVTVESFDAAFPQQVRTLCRDSQQTEAFNWLGEGLTGPEKDSYLLSVTQSLQATPVVAELPMIERNRFREALTRALTSALDGSLEAGAALQKAAADWKTILDDVGKERVRDSYRRRLGLIVR